MGKIHHKLKDVQQAIIDAIIEEGGPLSSRELEKEALADSPLKPLSKRQCIYRALGALQSKAIIVNRGRRVGYTLSDMYWQLVEEEASTCL